ncbi:hypothetical protein CHLRE_17g728000v5 [Chlamydomonas reinhardtii]|uniref:Uncharacterized protein n=1 Tax=Chlamydomonas reinhardtii TaxID=3055 RepID=A0A2K3CQS5_CHLRE|nr:uncharacterized protein CHLRE_17g728000v5 [Chlamydomonas reinhardtii]PNW70632.1 hypothetical protein CHLRE_17g728000v5 [Chlamydomonas reinhardtii]
MQLHASRIAGNLAVTDAVLGEAVCIVTKAANVMNGIKNNSGLLERMDAKLDALAADVGGIKSEVGGIKAQVEAVKEDVGGVKAKLGVVEAKVEHIDAKLEDMRRVFVGIKAGQDSAPRPS